MSKTIRIWRSQGLLAQCALDNDLELLIKDFVAYLKGELYFNGLGGIKYLNAKYVLGTDVPFDRNPVKLVGIDYPRGDYSGTCNHIHVLDKTIKIPTSSQKNIYDDLISNRRTKERQEKWTGDMFLVYYRHSMIADSYGILDFWVNAHSNFSPAAKTHLQNLIDEYENAVADEEDEAW
ncbi:type II toxin-antitoxin system YafO family toxin [Hahella sp. CR1]|uniref:hypothetical protein n=1 Tax=Hahella sp. CR1 TaxID=2992807 RepID=UPI0024423A56|nr:hypothetical protein [Hahella sp. CR1]MDG9670637.1 type II toxin-antitoxin system YafO family toxin [Hahella sp. CR1]